MSTTVVATTPDGPVHYELMLSVIRETDSGSGCNVLYEAPREHIANYFRKNAKGIPWRLYRGMMSTEKLTPPFQVRRLKDGALKIGCTIFDKTAVAKIKKWALA